MNALNLQISGMTKRFGPVTALDHVSLTVGAGTVHALLGENGAGKSTLVKCLVGFYQPDEGSIVIDGEVKQITSPKDADKLGIGMVYQHFTLVPSMTIAENLVASAAKLPGFINWRRELERLTAITQTLPFSIDLNVRTSQLSAGERQKAELIKQLYLGRRLLILDEPTSVLTPGEAEQVLGYVRQLTTSGKLSAILITHKFDEVRRYADDVTILRKGAAVKQGAVKDLSNQELAEAMVGTTLALKTERSPRPACKEHAALAIKGLTVKGDIGLDAVKELNLCVNEGEIVGVAGVSGNGQMEMVEALMGQRSSAGEIRVDGTLFHGSRKEIAKLGVYGLPQEPLKNACVPRMSLAENLALRNFDRRPLRKGVLLDRKALKEQAERLVKQFKVKAGGLDVRVNTLSGGNVQRAVLGRELTQDVRVLIASNPTFGLDFLACEETHNRILEARNAGAAVLLVSEDLDELLQLVDRIVVMSQGRIVYEVPAVAAEIHIIGKYMAGESTPFDTEKEGPSL
ncbi:ABC transporter ATP-binding protein [Ralstonia mannitolilytica]|uniref:Arabinose import ATP-binding protein AraG n=1 Tax=Ralstonia mannitolilytica TaxID=105219 RepID=A0AAJ4ZLB6_9RALS|nr:ABC transporter ATP-binding protein [Ralstonia mannitolilytica]CAG2151834.1 Galactose/methyl galactoside import ATP-binding protein MglA [Ralstonia mannitolilytica]SUD87885.1 Arabinose import ATP-binding protein AraG [Ralstonia mannitolilytica]SUD93791.1 Arabinose import ATP-binding protein AraG [Ralstonia mannitolilytica]SUD97545.1 Arabinose import ATP-binding protein AraG [Ralstonia mannitolilytica]